MVSRICNKLWAAAFLVLALGLAASAALAHEDSQVGDYKLVVGFVVEPAYEGLPNGVEVRVTKAADDGQGMTMQGHTGMAMKGHDGGTENGQKKTMVDLEGHGAIFGSAGIGQEESFSYKVDHMLEGMTIPYHNHADHDVTGSITVSHDAALSGTVEIEIHDSMYMPADVTVQAGTSLVWTNKTSSPQTVTSGPPPGGDHADEMPQAEGAHHNQPNGMAMKEEAPVEGLEQTLQVEVTHVPTKASRVMDLRAVFEKPGDYAADLIPTAQGVYEIRVFGTIEGNEVDETFISQGGGGGFSDVLPASDLHFPEPLTGNRELEGAVRGALDTAQQAQDAALSAQEAAIANGNSATGTLAVLGIVLGAVGLASGAGSLILVIRKR